MFCSSRGTRNKDPAQYRLKCEWFSVTAIGEGAGEKAQRCTA